MITSAERTQSGKAEIAAVVVPCASRKRSLPPPDLRAFALSPGLQETVAQAWSACLSKAKPIEAARDTYMGRGFSLGRGAAERSGAPLFVVSAGLGLVAGTRAIPSYGLTVSSRDVDGVGRKTHGRFDAGAWWGSVKAGPFSTDWVDVFSAPGAVLMAISQGYATLIANDLESLDEHDRSRLRLFGIGLGDVVPASVKSQIMPYDERLDVILPGTRTDFAQRALSHFVVSDIARAEAAEAGQLVCAALRDVAVPMRPVRPRASDDELVGAIRRHLRTTKGIGRILSRLRQEDRIACEQRRFTRLYRVAEELEVAR